MFASKHKYSPSIYVLGIQVNVFADFRIFFFFFQSRNRTSRMWWNLQFQRFLGSQRVISLECHLLLLQWSCQEENMSLVSMSAACMELIRVVQLCSCIQFKQLSSMSAKLRDFFYCWLRSSHNGMQVIYDSLRYLMMGICNNETWPRNEYTTQHHVHAQLRCRANLVYLRGEKCQTGILLLSGGNLPDTFSLNIFSRVSDNSS